MSDTVRTGVAHFVITGEAMTELGRDLLLSDEPGKAYRLVADGLIGEGATDAALSVLKGTHDLAGDSTNGLELVEAEDNEALRGFKANYRYIYAGRHRRRGAWRRPVAFVRTFGREDAKQASRDHTVGTPAWHRARAMYYAGEGETVEALMLPEGKVWVIWEPCGEMPHWMKPSTTAQEALADALEAGRPLEQRVAERSEPEVGTTLGPLTDEDWDEHDRQREARLQEIGEKVREQAGDDTFVLELKDGRKFQVPRAPFIRWALCRTASGRTDLKDTAPDWENVAPSGMKMQMDNPDHTDWVLGSGLTLDEAYNEDVNEAAWDAAFKFQEEARNAKLPYAGIRAAMEMLDNTIHEAAAVVDAGVRTGIVGVDIAVFPDSQGSRANQLGQSIGVIVEKGGKLAHFAIVTKGRGITVMRHPDACELFPEGTRVSLNPAIGRIIVDYGE